MDKNIIKKNIFFSGSGQGQAHNTSVMESPNSIAEMTPQVPIES